MCAKRERKELWRLGINGVITHVFAASYYSIGIIAYLPSLHRFVTNPGQQSLNSTELGKVEPGLGETEVFYSFVVACLYIGSIIGGLGSAILIKYVPYWHLFLFFISCNILGYILYGTTTLGWVLAIGMLLVGLFLGAEVTLIFNYATDLSMEYVELLKERGEQFKCEQSQVIKIRNYLYTSHSVGYSIGYVIGAGVGVLFSHLPIEQYRSVAWFNLACGLTLFVLFAFLFRGESSWKSRVSQCRKSHCCRPEVSLRPIQIFILVSLLALSFVEMLKWAYLDVLLNPVLSDSFGLSLKVSSYFYLGLAIPRILGAVAVLLLQKMKLSSQVIALIGLIMAVVAYLLIADWQTIPYDPCTEYSPYHHPDRFLNQTKQPLNKTSVSPPQNTPLLTPLLLTALDVHSELELNLDSGESLSFRLPGHSQYKCHADNTCYLCGEDITQPCLSFTVDPSGQYFIGKRSTQPQLFTCSLDSLVNFCVNVYQGPSSEETDLRTEAEIQRLLVLPDDVYNIASNACVNALDGQCHWIPFSTLTGKKCLDCPPICRGKQQTLLFPLFLIGIAIQLLSNPFVWIPTIALANNQSPKSIQALVIGAVNTVNALGQSIGPIFVETLYEGTQKRTFLPSLLLAILHVPFMIEIIVLYRRLGPKIEKKTYQKLKDEEVD